MNVGLNNSNSINKMFKSNRSSERRTSCESQCPIFVSTGAAHTYEWSLNPCSCIVRGYCAAPPLIHCPDTLLIYLHFYTGLKFVYGTMVPLFVTFLYQFLNKCSCCKMFMNPGWLSRCYIIRPSPGLHGLTMYEGSKPWSVSVQVPARPFIELR